VAPAIYSTGVMGENDRGVIIRGHRTLTGRETRDRIPVPVAVIQVSRGSA